MYTKQDVDQDIHDVHDRAQHDNDVRVHASPQSVQRATETSVQCFFTMCQTTYYSVVSRSNFINFLKNIDIKEQYMI